MSALTPEEMLFDMEVHARSGIVHVEPKMVALWRENIGHVLCGAAFDAGLAQAETQRLLDARAAHMSKVDRMVAEEREACAQVAEQLTPAQALVSAPATTAALIRARGRR